MQNTDVCMVWLTILFALALSSYAEEYKHRNNVDLMRTSLQCLVEKNITKELMAKYKQFEYPDDKLTHAYIECVLEKLQLFDPQKGFNTDNLLAQLAHNKPNVDEIKADIEKCAHLNSENSDVNNRAYIGFKCFVEKNLHLVQDELKRKLIAKKRRK